MLKDLLERFAHWIARERAASEAEKEAESEEAEKRGGK